MPRESRQSICVHVYLSSGMALWFWSVIKTIMTACVWACHEYLREIIFFIKADCVWVGRKILEAKGKSRSTTFVQREKRNFQTAQNGVFPSVAIFAGQLKRNQLYTLKTKCAIFDDEYLNYMYICTHTKHAYISCGCQQSLVNPAVCMSMCTHTNMHTSAMDAPEPCQSIYVYRMWVYINISTYMYRHTCMYM